MCMIDDGDGYVTTLAVSDPVARKEHRCNECRRTIRAGEKYRSERHVFEGRFTHHKTCAHCMVARGWLSRECGGWLYGAVEEDMQEHAESRNYGIRVAMLYVGMVRKWTCKDGRMWPVPKVPMTTHEQQGAKQ